MIKLKEKLYEFFSLLMFILVIILSIKIFDNNYYFEFNKISLANLFTYNFNLNNIFINNDDKSVNKEFKYIKDNDLYFSTSNYIFSIDDCFVYKINKEQIITLLINKWYAIYYGEFEVFVNEGDYVEKNKKIANYFNGFNICLIKGDEIINYEEYIKNPF